MEIWVMPLDGDNSRVCLYKGIVDNDTTNPNILKSNLLDSSGNCFSPSLEAIAVIDKKKDQLSFYGFKSNSIFGVIGVGEGFLGSKQF
jgi:hypothetical protein